MKMETIIEAADKKFPKFVDTLHVPPESLDSDLWKDRKEFFRYGFISGYLHRKKEKKKKKQCTP